MPRRIVGQPVRNRNAHQCSAPCAPRSTAAVYARKAVVTIAVNRYCARHGRHAHPRPPLFAALPRGALDCSERTSHGINNDLLASERHGVATLERVDAWGVVARHLGLPLVSGHRAAAGRTERRVELRAGFPSRAAHAHCQRRQDRQDRQDRQGRQGRCCLATPDLRFARGGRSDAGLGVRRDDFHGHFLGAVGWTDRNGRQRFGRDVGGGGHGTPSPHCLDGDSRRHGDIGVVWPRGPLHRRPALARLGCLRQSGATVCERCLARADRGHQPASGQPRLSVGGGGTAGSRLAALQPLPRVGQKTRLRHRPLFERVDFVCGHLFQHFPLGGAGRGRRLVAGVRFGCLRAPSGPPRSASSHDRDRGCAGGRVQRCGDRAPSVRFRHRAPGGSGSAPRVPNVARRHFRRNGNYRHLERTLRVYDHRQAGCPPVHVFRGLAKVCRHRIDRRRASISLSAPGHGRRSRARQPEQRKPRWRGGHKRSPRRQPHVRWRLHGGGGDEVPGRGGQFHLDDYDQLQRRLVGIDRSRDGRGKPHEWLE